MVREGTKEENLRGGMGSKETITPGTSLGTKDSIAIQHKDKEWQ